VAGGGGGADLWLAFEVACFSSSVEKKRGSTNGKAYERALKCARAFSLTTVRVILIHLVTA
jgi:hypothetical protein